MAISLIGTAQVGRDNAVDSDPVGSALTVLSGDIVVVGTSMRFGSGYNNLIVHGTSTASATIVELAEDFTAGSSLTLAYYKVTAGGSLVVSADMDAVRAITYGISQWRGVDNDTPIVGTVGKTAGTGTTLTGAAATPGKAGDVVLAHVVAAANFASFTGTGGSWTQVGEVDNVSDSPPHMRIEQLVAPDTTPVTSAPTYSSSSDYRTGVIVLNAAPEIIPGTTVARGLYL